LKVEARRAINAKDEVTPECYREKILRRDRS
jgi:hypothetical protein